MAAPPAAPTPTPRTVYPPPSAPTAHPFFGFPRTYSYPTRSDQYTFPAPIPAALPSSTIYDFSALATRTSIASPRSLPAKPHPLAASLHSLISPTCAPIRPTPPPVTNRQAIEHLASQRAAFLHESSPLPFHPPPSRPSRTKRAPVPRQAAPSQLLSLASECWTCGAPIATLNLRGVEWERIGERPRIVLRCGDCVGGGEDGQVGQRTGTADDEGGYEDTISAAVDRLQLGTSGEKQLERIPPPVALAKGSPKDSDALACECCL